MGTLALAAKITHVPNRYLCEFPGPHQGKLDAAVAGHVELDRRCRTLGVDTMVVFDLHWQVNRDYHINCEQVHAKVVQLWEQGAHATVIDMLPMYIDKCDGEGDMHDTAIIYGVLGGRRYGAAVEVITPYSGSSGTGQINANIPVTPLIN
jgi:aromatic ring-opening dioxygenase catalytic subunit (LigB family)